MSEREIARAADALALGRWARLFVMVTQHRLREAVVLVAAGGFGIGFGVTLAVLPSRHFVPTLDSAYSWGVGPSVWGAVLFGFGLWSCIAVRWHDNGAPALPLSLLALVTGFLMLFTLQAAITADGVPGAVWLYMTAAALCTLLSASYGAQEWIKREQSRRAVATRTQRWVDSHA